MDGEEDPALRPYEVICQTSACENGISIELLLSDPPPLVICYLCGNEITEVSPVSQVSS